MGKNRQAKGVLRAAALLLCVITISIFLRAEYGGAKKTDLLNLSKFQPLSKVPSVSCQPLKSSQVVPAQNDRMLSRLKECINTIRSNKGNSSARQSTVQTRQVSTAFKDMKMIIENLDIWRNTQTGAPRQIKMKSDAKLRGMILQKAIEGITPGRERDEKTARLFLSSNRALLRIANPDDEMRLDAYMKDEIGRRHLRYNQEYRGLKVWPAQLNVHINAEGNVDLMNGAFIPTPQRLIVKPVWRGEEASDKARSTVPDADRAKTSKPELIIYAPGDKIPRLAWKMEVDVSIESNWLVVIDALNGNTLTAYNLIKKENTYGSGVDLSGVNRQLNVWHEKNQYYMVDTSKQMYDSTSNPPAIDTTRGAIIIKDMTHNEMPEGSSFNADYVTSNNPNAGWIPEAVSLSWAFSETYDYYLERHNRNSLDNQGHSIIGFVRIDWDNACWDPSSEMMFFGETTPYVKALDVVAHEFTHGVTDFDSHLIYQNQSGALSEAFSDIYGEMVEARTFGQADWINGAALDDNGRNIKDPSSQKVLPQSDYCYPSKMSEFYGSNHPFLQMLKDKDYGGVHINCTIISYCYYLLAQGIPGAIGLQDAEKIFYRAQKYHLVSNSQFVDCRLACIASAEELFGGASVQAKKVAEAFDAVEVFENIQTPEPPPTQPVNSDDSVMFISYSYMSGGYFLTRQENALGDSSVGTWISCYDVAQSRPSVSGDGTYAFFVDSINDACFLSTDGSFCEDCLGFPGMIHSVAMSPDGEVYGFVVLDEYGDPINEIMVADLRQEDSMRTFPLVSPVIDGVALNTVLFADAMDFSSDNRYLFYDAYNVLEFNDGTKIGAWSIYAIDLVTEQTISLFGPLAGVDVGYPALSQTTNHLVTFDAVDQITGNSSIFAVNLISLDYDIVATVNGSYGVPGYTGDDSAIVYSYKDASASTGFSLLKQALTQEGISPTGNPTLFMKDAEFGVIYRRGDFNSPAPKISVSPSSLSFGSVTVGEKLRKQLTISNEGTADLLLQEINISGSNDPQYTIIGGCAGQTLPSTGTCNFYVDFIPTSNGIKNANLSIHSNDPDSLTLNIQLSGSGNGGATELPAPFSFDAKSKAANQITLCWKESATNESGFKIEQKSGSCESSSSWYQIATVPENSLRYTVSGLSPNTPYSFRARAYNALGNSAFSNCASAVTASPGTPPAPTNLVAESESDNVIKLTWNEIATNEKGFEIWRKAGKESWKFLTSVGSDVRTYEDNTAFNNTASISYGYFIMSYNNAGYSPKTYPVIVPYQPVGILLQPLSRPGKIKITWSDSSNNENGFEVWRKTGSCSSSGDWQLAGKVAGNRDFWFDTGRSSGKTYSYKVRAYKRTGNMLAAYGYSGWSDCISAVSP